MTCPGNNCYGASALEQLSCDDCIVGSVSAAREHEAGPEITTLIPSEIPLDMPDFHLQTDPGASGRGGYRIRNTAGVGLVTLVSAVTFVGPDGDLTVVNVADSWDRDVPFVGAGGEKELPMSLVVGGSPIWRIQVKVVYAEFEDGTRLGPGVPVLSECLTAQRVRVLEAYGNALHEYRTGGDEALNVALQETPELTWLLAAKEKGGFAAVVAELSKERRFTP